LFKTVTQSTNTVQFVIREALSLVIMLHVTHFINSSSKKTLRIFLLGKCCNILVSPFNWLCYVFLT